MANLKFARAAIQALRDEGYEDVTAETTNGGHLRLRFTHNGKRTFVITAVSPSDYRVLKNVVRDARKQALGVPITMKLFGDILPFIGFRQPTPEEAEFHKLKRGIFVIEWRSFSIIFALD